MEREAKLVKKHREDTDREEWALVSRKTPSKVLQWFGTEKPSDEAVAKAEARVEFFKHQASDDEGGYKSAAQLLAERYRRKYGG
jgi:hypothetical protein